jgi:preprotein translocase subunit SecF
LLFVGSFAFGAHTLREFALALFIGIAIGTYSSIFVAAPLLAIWKEREDDWTVARKRATRRRSGDTGEAIVDTPKSPDAVVPAAPVAQTGASGAAARAPRKRKKRR